MTDRESTIAEGAMPAPGVMGVSKGIYRGIRDRPRLLFLLLPGRFCRVCAVLALLTMMAGCGNSDPLPVAAGPLYPLNAGQWQPTARDLAAPPRLSNN